MMMVKRFFGFLLQEGYLSADPSRRLPTPKVGQRLPRVLSVSELQRLFATFDDTTPIGRRDKMFFLISYAAGLRISETAHLRVEDIDWNEGSLRVVGKGDKERRIYLKPMVLEALREYIRESQVSGFLFPGAKAGAISNGAMEQRFKECVKAVGLNKRVMPHCLRHSIAVHYLMGGAPLSFVQNFLGHSDLATTGIYTRLTDPMAKEIALRIPTATDAVEKKRKERVLRENRPEPGEELEYWLGFVRDVLEWPAHSQD